MFQCTSIVLMSLLMVIDTNRCCCCFFCFDRAPHLWVISLLRTSENPCHLSGNATCLHKGGDTTSTPQAMVRVSKFRWGYRLELFLIDNSLYIRPVHMCSTSGCSPGCRINEHRFVLVSAQARHGIKPGSLTVVTTLQEATRRHFQLLLTKK